ncbi:MAG: hypothetical protein CMJ48_14780 [Planctomycetaceae bacterium]|nr:hypothetical protein [Planctomycetaceae bacterium]
MAILIGGGALLIALVTCGTYIALSPTAIPRFRLVGRWVQVDAYSDVFRTSGSEIHFSASGAYSKSSYVRGGGAFTHEQRGRWSLQEVNGDEMIVHVNWQTEPNGDLSSTVGVWHLSFESPRRVQMWVEGSTATYTYERR